MSIILFIIYFAFTLVVLYRNMQSPIWEIGSAVYLFLATFIVGLPWISALLLWFVVATTILFMHVEAVRAALSDFLFKRIGKSIPKLSKTEEEALNAGDTWLEKDIFVGAPDWNKLQSISTNLTEEEQAFIDNEVQTLCGMLNEWEIQRAGDLPESVWDYIKRKRLFGVGYS